MNAVFILLLLVTLTNLLLVMLVLWYRHRAEVNRVFGLTAFAVAGWTLTNALFQSTHSVATATQAAAFSYLSAIVLGASFLHFSWVFPRRSNITSSGKAGLWIITALVGTLPFLPGVVIRAVDITGNRAILTHFGIYAIAAFMIVTSGWAFGNFVRGFRYLHGLARSQTHYVLAGAALTAIIGLICNLLLPLLGNYALVWLGPTSSLFFVAFSVYAIVAHHLFDIRIIIKRTVLYTLLLAGIGAGYSIIESMLSDTLKHAADGSQYAWLANIGGAIAVSFCVAPVRQWLEEYLDRLLFRSRHKARHTRDR